MKKRLLCPRLPAQDHPVPLSEAEGHHAVQVLRLRDGDLVQALDGKGGTTEVRLRTREGPVRVEWVEAGEIQPQGLVSVPIVPLVLEIAVLKGSAMEWLIEKAVELGVQKLVPVLTIRTVVKIDRPEKFLSRWEKIADQALKQCGRLERMEIGAPTPVESLSGQHRIWCDEASSGDDIEILEFLQARSWAAHLPLHILIGPEGGWDPRERNMLMSRCSPRTSLGPLVLRAETAAIYSASLAGAFLRQKFRDSGKSAS